MKRTILLLITLACLLACLPACSPQETEQPTATAEPLADSRGVLRIAYSNNADPWIWTEGETPIQVADSVNVQEVRLSSDGQVVVFKRDDSGELLAVNADGQNLRTLVPAGFLTAEQAGIWQFDLAPGSHTVYFTMQAALAEFTPLGDLWQVDADATSPAPTLVLAPGQGGIATFSPDGVWMALYHIGGLDLARSDGSAARTVISYPDGYEPATIGPEIIWKADSSGFFLFHVDMLQDDGNGAIWFVPVAGEPQPGTPLGVPWGVVSPDGQSAAYVSPGSPAEIHILAADGNDTLYATLEDVSFGGWLPDSQHFTIIKDVAVEDFYGMAKQYYLGAPGEELVRLTDTVDAYPVVWLTNDTFLFASLNELRMQTIGEASVLLDEGVYNMFRFTWVAP